MRTVLGHHPVFSILLAVAACGGSSKPTTPATGPSNPPTPTLGTSGLTGLDWGASAEAVRAAYPQATASEGGLAYVGPAEGGTAVTRFAIGDGGLTGVVVEFTDGFISMTECGKGWARLRATLDQRFGDSKADNLAAYWDTATASIVLACNPNERDAGVLSLTYGHRDDD